jgi:hypothetical protein
MKEALLALGSGRALLQGRATADALIRRGLVERKRPMYPGSGSSWLSVTCEGYQAIIDLNGPADPSLDELLAESEGSCSGWCRPPENLCGWCSRQTLVAERDRLRAALGLAVEQLEEVWKTVGWDCLRRTLDEIAALAPADDRAETEEESDG